MKYVYTIMACSFMAFSAKPSSAQGIFLTPSPTDVNAPGVKLYVDLSSEACNCPAIQNADPETNPLYLWTWQPTENRPPLNGENVNNGSWTDSNENLRMQRDADNPNLWYYDFMGASLTEFYGLGPSGAEIILSTGISFLLKAKSGSGAPEPKSPDLNVQITSLSASQGGQLVWPVLFPNPAAQEVYIQVPADWGSQNHLVQIYSMDGRLVDAVQSAKDGQGILNLPIAHLPSGLYLLNVQASRGQRHAMRFVKN